ncbi:hypothetical protein VHUM_03174 [Vanrija humicola]|uniref:Uncharacterized protein n=1 Tax=Vanrija humicola TaxID=5417 RepID=A0A7D8UYQ3_VANHU|nr:hypothetical protein VHUM_03174 [Vanrija humicola]
MIAAAYVQNGAKVYIASRKLADLERVAAQLTEAGNKAGTGGKAIAIQADVGSKAGCDALADAIKARESNLDILVNNSGLSWGAPLVDFPEANGWDKTFALNVKSQFYLTVALLPILEKNKTNVNPAVVINVASIAALSPSAEGALSAAGEASLHLTKVLASSFTKRHVNVNAILPGVFPSRMTSFGIENAGDELLRNQPTGRVGTPEDIGGIAVFLSSRAGAHCTGTSIVVDGGQLLGATAKL